MDGVGQHPLSLKVMRISRPSLAAHWQPFFSSSPSFSAHSTASPLSLQGAEPLPGHPKTLRDLTHASNFLTLPSAFGTIQLGETFSCVLSVNNEVDVPVDAVRARVEMQTATSKALLAEVAAGALESQSENVTETLNTRDSLEMSVSTEIKELGQHVLACIVTYRTPPGMRPATSGGDNAVDPFMQTFRKFYKFIVTNPLSVKSKVHVPKSPTALLSRSERDKLFLEVHIQNLTQGPLWFEKIQLEPVDGWNVIDPNFVSAPSSHSNPESRNTQSIFSDSMALMPAQDMRQYLYILTPNVIPRKTSVFVPPTPGTVIPLGRLDITWRSPMGEPGRLLTSVLSRRVPLPTPPSSNTAPASAIPPYLQKTVMPNTPRPRSPSLQQHIQQQHRMATPPPNRPGSPFKHVTTPGVPARPQSPSTNIPPVPSLPVQLQPLQDVQVNLVLLERPEEASVQLEEPFSLRFSLAVSALLPSNAPSLLGDPAPRKSRVVTLAVQHTLSAPMILPEQVSGAVAAPFAIRTLKKRTSTMTSFDTTSSGIHSPSSRTGSIDMLTPRRVVSPPPVPASVGGESLVTSPTSTAARAANTVTVGGLTERLRRVALSEALGLRESETDGTEAFGDGDEANGTEARLPPPYSNFLKPNGQSVTGKVDGRVQFNGTSITYLPPLTLTPPLDVQASSPGAGPADRGEACVEFTLSYVPRRRGFARVGGLRALLVKDEMKEERLPEEGDEEVTVHTQGEVQSTGAQILYEWDTIAEVWVR